MRQAKAWTEAVSFVECPNPDCGEVIELGSEIVFNEKPTEETCLCGTRFLIFPPDGEIPTKGKVFDCDVN